MVSLTITWNHLEGDCTPELSQAVDFYKDDLPHHKMFTVEYRMWVRKWKQCSKLVPERIVDALQQCDEIEFPSFAEACSDTPHNHL